MELFQNTVTARIERKISKEKEIRLKGFTRLIPVHLIDIYNVIEAVRDAGLNAVELNAGISVTRLENLVSSLFNQLSKRLPTTHTINPRESTVLLVEFLLAAIDR